MTSFTEGIGGGYVLHSIGVEEGVHGTWGKVHAA